MAQSPLLPYTHSNHPLNHLILPIDIKSKREVHFFL